LKNSLLLDNFVVSQIFLLTGWAKLARSLAFAMRVTVFFQLNRSSQIPLPSFVILVSTLITIWEGCFLQDFWKNFYFLFWRKLENNIILTP